MQLFILTQINPTTGPETDWRHEIRHCECVTRQYSHPSIDFFSFFFFLLFSPSKCHKVSRLPRTDLFRRWISRRIGSWWPFSSEAMTCVSTATTEWVAAGSRHGDFAAFCQIKGSVHKKAVDSGKHNNNNNNNDSPSRCVTPGAQNRLMISLGQNSEALWAALPTNCFVVSDLDETCFPLQWAHSATAAPFLSAIPASVSRERTHGAQWQALFWKRHKQQPPVAQIPTSFFFIPVWLMRCV